MLTLCLINTFPFFWLMKQAQDKSSLKPYVRTCIALVLIEQFWASKHFEQQALLVLWIPPPKFEPWRKSLQVAPILHPLPPPHPQAMSLTLSSTHLSSSRCSLNSHRRPDFVTAYVLLWLTPSPQATEQKKLFLCSPRIPDLLLRGTVCLVCWNRKVVKVSVSIVRQKLADSSCTHF